MEKYMILGSPYDGHLRNSKNYRGVQRNFLPKFESKTGDEGVEIFYNSIIESDSNVVSDLSSAKAICEAFNSGDQIPQEKFEVIKVAFSESDVYSYDEVLGWDIIGTKENESIIAEFLDPSLTVSGKDMTVEAPLIRLLRSYFSSILNSNVLFYDFKSAIFFLDCLRSIHKCNSEYFSWSMEKFRPVGIIKM